MSVTEDNFNSGGYILTIGMVNGDVTQVACFMGPVVVGDSICDMLLLGCDAFGVMVGQWPLCLEVSTAPFGLTCLVV